MGINNVERSDLSSVDRSDGTLVDREGIWFTFADGTSATTGATVTGLTNGTAYEFRVAAVNAIGQGPWSNIAGPYTPAAGGATVHTFMGATSILALYLGSTAVSKMYLGSTQVFPAS